MIFDLSEDEIIVMRQALREFRTVAPAHIMEKPSRLERWLEERSLWDDTRSKLDNKMTGALAEIFDQKAGV